MRSIRAISLLLLGLTLLLLAGCASDLPVQRGPTPTQSSLFAQPTLTPVPTVTASPETASPAAALTPPVVPDPTSTDLNFTTVAIFEDALLDDWSTEFSQGVRPRRNTAITHSGDRALSLNVENPSWELFFTVNEDAENTYPADKVLRVSFWFNSSDGIVETDDLALRVLGSNEFPYYDPDDDSVQGLENESCNPFCATRLYFLGFNRPVPPNTWAQVVLDVDQLQFDPIYEYVTGLVIIGDEDFTQDIYIDKVELILVEDTPASTAND